MPWDKIEVVIITAYVGKDEIKNELLTKYKFKGTTIAIHDDIHVPLYRLISKKNIAPVKYDEISILQKNSKYKNIHAGERVFVLCTGPSIKRMDLTRLKNEKVIATSGFYLHKDCQLIAPDYYCLPTIEELTLDEKIEFLREIQQVLQRTNYFFRIADKLTVEKIEEYKREWVNYLSFTSIPNYESCDIDLTSSVLGPQSVSIIALEIALYLGFQEVYLLGTEHDSLVAGKYEHFYSYHESIVSKVAEWEDAQGNDSTPFDLLLRCTYNLWEQYKIMKIIAERMGTKIYNATQGGVLDVFERVDYDMLF